MIRIIAVSPSNRMSYASLLRRCGNAKSLQEGKRVHSQIIRNGHDQDQYIGNVIVQMYGKCGALDEACTAFAKMPERNVFSWKLLIGAFLELGLCNDAFQLFQQMLLEGVMPDRVTYLIMISACASQVALVEGNRIHTRTVGDSSDSDVIMGTAILDMYGKCGSLENAWRTFDNICHRNVVSWNAMIAANVQHGQSMVAHRLFQRMQLEGSFPDHVTIGTVFCACATLAALSEGKQIHVYIAGNKLESDLTVGNALVNMYSKCGSLKDAWMVFKKMPEKTVVSWSSMISACAMHDQATDTLELFYQMHLEGVIPNHVTFISTLPVCASQSGLAENKRMHARITGTSFESDVVVQSALVSMYSKGGSLKDAKQVFNEMPDRNVISWNSMIAAYAQHGQSKEALQLFTQMQSYGVIPTAVTFVCILSACSHTGLVDEGCRYFVSMSEQYGITPEIEHYDCMIDLLGRAGQLDEIDKLVTNMPCQPSPTSWTTLLSACKMQLDVHRGKCAAQCVLKLDPDNATPYVLLSNIYAAAGWWDAVAKVRKLKIDSEEAIWPQLYRSEKCSAQTCS